jgi:hypothetical protein
VSFIGSFILKEKSLYHRQLAPPVKNLVVKDMPPFPGWRVSVHYILNGRAQIKKLVGRTPEVFGSPGDGQNLSAFGAESAHEKDDKAYQQ